MVAILDGSCGFGSWNNMLYVRRMKKYNLEDQLKLIKELYLKDTERYIEWKDWCIRLNMLPDFFGTRDDPIPIDESKL